MLGPLIMLHHTKCTNNNKTTFLVQIAILVQNICYLLKNINFKYVH